MSNDEIKQFIDQSKLYTEVDLEENKKVEEGLIALLKGLFKSEVEAEKVINTADPEEVERLDRVIDDNNLDAFGGPGAPVTNNVKGGGQDNNVTTARKDKVAKTKDLANKTTTGKTPPTGPGGDEALPTSSRTATTTTTNKTPPTGPGGDEALPTSSRTATTNKTPPTGPGGDEALPTSSRTATAATTTTADTPPPGTDATGETPSATPASNGSLLGRKLDTTTANLMKAYNDGGKKSMPEIKNLQTALSRLGHDPNGLDGKYGQGTYAAVQAFQKANGLSADGQAGPGTMAAIKKALDDNFEKNKATPDAQEKPAAPTDQEGGVAQGIDQADDVGDDGMTDAERDAGAGQFANDAQATDPNARATRGSDSAFANDAQATDPTARATRGSDSAFANDPQAAAPKVSKEVHIQGGGGATDFNIAQMKQKYPTPYVEIPQEDGNVTRGYGALANLQAYKKKNPAAKIIGQQQAGKPNAERDGAERGVQTASKDNNMKKAIKEASMNISINGDSAAEVAELAGILKNAGMHDAKPVSDIIPHAHDGHDDMVSKMRMMDEPAPDDSPCGMGEEGVEEDWDNSPDESYADHQTMTHDLSGGINRRKPQGAIRVKDPAVALETSIKEQLWAALNEKMTAEGRGRGKKMKLKASRGNEDIQTTEGSRGKKSRGKKKSRG